MWHRDNDRFRTFTRRAAILGGGKAVLLSTLAARMYYLQVTESDKYAMLADENRISMRLLAPPRGTILDRFGRPLAVNTQNYRLLIVREQTPSMTATLDALAQIVELTEEDRQRVLKDARRRRSFVPVTVRDNLSWEEVARIEVNAPDLPGVAIDTGLSRSYPDGPEAAHVLGYVAAVSERELTGDPLLELPDFRVGKSGLEKVYDLDLRGRAGNSQVEVNAVGRVIRELSRQEGAPGRDLLMTVDMDLQRYATERLDGTISAAAVVMDVHNGDVLSMASYPSFDPNVFTMGITRKEWRGLINNPRTPLINKAVSGVYAPGSTFKMVVALAALEAGVITPAHTVFCPGYFDLGDSRFHCWKITGHGSVDMHEAIKQSCDVWFYETSLRVGIDRIAAMARRFGMGDETGIDLSGEKGGTIPTKAWKLTAIGRRWQKGETVVAAIGQGYVLASPLQLAVMTARIASGQAVTPRLTRRIDAAGGLENPEFPPLGIDRDGLARIRRAMAAVSNEHGGTAYSARIPIAGLELAGKTGTAQVKRITMRERRDGTKDRAKPWEERDHALFVAFAPVDKPRYACAVVVEHGGSGSRAAAPIARDLLIKAQQLNSARPPAAMAVFTAGRDREV